MSLRSDFALRVINVESVLRHSPLYTPDRPITAAKDNDCLGIYLRISNFYIIYVENVVFFQISTHLYPRERIFIAYSTRQIALFLHSSELTERRMRRTGPDFNSKVCMG